MLNPAVLLKLKGAYETFVNNHPKFPMFLKAASKDALQEGSIVEITVTTKEGKKMSTNLLVKQSDLDLFESLKQMF